MGTRLTFPGYLRTEIAHLPQNFDFSEEDPTLFDFAFEEVEEKPTFLPTDIAEMSCGELMKLTEEEKESSLTYLLHSEAYGILERVIGPECMFLGPVEEVALVRDASLLLPGSKPEKLYYNSETKILFVPDSERHTIAYGLEKTDETDPLEYFRDRRDFVEQIAAGANVRKELAIRIEEETTVREGQASSISAVVSSSRRSATSVESEESSLPDAGIDEEGELSSSSSVASVPQIIEPEGVPLLFLLGILVVGGAIAFVVWKRRQKFLSRGGGTAPPRP